MSGNEKQTKNDHKGYPTAIAAELGMMYVQRSEEEKRSARRTIDWLFRDENKDDDDDDGGAGDACAVNRDDQPDNPTILMAMATVS